MKSKYTTNQLKILNEMDSYTNKDKSLKLNYSIPLRINPTLFKNLNIIEKYSSIIYDEKTTRSQIIRIAINREILRVMPLINETKKIKRRFENGKLL